VVSACDQCEPYTMVRGHDSMKLMFEELLAVELREPWCHSGTV
jgi:hypothetical protein